MKKALILCMLVLGCVYLSSAQKFLSNQGNDKPTLTDLSRSHSQIELGENSHPFGGTFQFIISKNAKTKEIFTDEILRVVEENRLDNEEKTLVLSPNTKVWILSKTQINDPKFVPLTNLYSIEK
jgi:hypothetical protein